MYSSHEGTSELCEIIFHTLAGKMFIPSWGKARQFQWMNWKNFYFKIERLTKVGPSHSGHILRMLITWRMLITQKKIR